MKYPRIFCLTIILSLLITPFTNNTLIPTKGEFEFTENWQYKGVINQQNQRIKYIPIYPTDGVTKSVLFDPYVLRTFIFLLDDINDADTTPDTIVALHGINEMRNAPLASLFWEEPAPGAEYGFNVSTESGMSWYDLTEDSPILNSSSPLYNEDITIVFNRTISKLITFPSVYLGHLLVPIHLAYFVSQTGVVGHWQQINKDQTIINGNFTTFGADDPIFVGPPDNPYPEDEWWPQYNITVAQNVARTSRPRTHSLEVDFPFLSIITSLGLAFIIFTLIKKSRRIKK